MHQFFLAFFENHKVTTITKPAKIRIRVGDETFDVIHNTGVDIEHFLDHKVNNILDAMRSVGDYEQADRFREVYDSTVDNDLIAADNLVNTYRDVVKDMSFDDADLKLRKGKKTGNLYGEIRNPSVSEFLEDFMK